MNMSKRRRTSSVASRGTEDDPDEIVPEPAKRKKKTDPVSFAVEYKLFLLILVFVALAKRLCEFSELCGIIHSMEL